MKHEHDAAFWDRMWSQRPSRSAEPNAFLVESVADLAPGTALDVGCGEGADAVWLATRGWTVTAVDISNVALERGRAADLERRVTWVQADISVWQPPADAYGLVSAHYLHVSPSDRPTFFDRLAQAVKPGGMLLFEAHHPSDLETTVGRPPISDLYFTPEEVRAAVSHGRWESLLSGMRPRAVHDREGRSVTIHETVVKVRRLA